ncbi:MAG TPA: biotin carboxylase N-terminal domain-containing protein [Candidatus Limnocylindrales bacterium]|nr:biotin carboxylase N-terminal domain-containing protein [Candidatus Limnocylindrales bacterium]
MTDELGPREAAARLGATTRSVQRWIATGRLPARRIGGRWRVASDAIDAFARETGPAEAPARPAAPATSASPIRTLFVANRGEIAARIERTCHRQGVRAVLPNTNGPDALDLLDADAVVRAAVASGADAVHPGFGFLAESADFAAAVEAAGLNWVGPPPAAIRAVGDKAAARRIASRLGVPVVYGYDGAAQSDAALDRQARRIGLPLMVKPAAGGGGKGMRIVRDRARLRDSLAGARREAQAAFGDDRLILERLVENARHVEVQVLFDQYGHGIHMGERDCSLQRRHQKILEETPSSAVDPELRARLGEAALTITRSVGYVSAGTVEFLLDDRGAFHFLEVNARLQVEHPITEAVTGRDLVADQLRIAAGEPLGLVQADVRATGHAVEVRLYAEDAEAGFLPSTGRVERLRWPGGEGIRVDAGITEGDVVGGRFDPMLAKIVAHGPDRPTALSRLATALDETVVLGLVTNLRFLRWLVRSDAVASGRARIDTLERIWPPDDWPTRVALPDEAWTAAARAVGGGWRLNGPPVARLVADGGGVERAVAVPAVAVDDAPVVAVGPDGVVHVDVGGRSVAFALAPPPDVDRAARRAAAHAHDGGPIDVLAPMPGSVIAVHVTPGSTVDAGDPLVTLEAMKMEHAVAAPIAGRVTSIAVLPGDQVARQMVLAVVEP